MRIYSVSCNISSKDLHIQSTFLKLESLKQDSSVIAKQIVAVNLHLNLAQTARQVFEVGLLTFNYFRVILFFIKIRVLLFLLLILKNYNFRMLIQQRRLSRNMVTVEESAVGENYDMKKDIQSCNGLF